MSLHSADYIRNLVGHVPSKMLSLRQDEVSVFSRMNIQGRRRVSLPSKLSGITEKGSSDGRDIQESLNKSYSEMKNKLMKKIRIRETMRVNTQSAQRKRNSRVIPPQTCPISSDLGS